MTIRLPRPALSFVALLALAAGVAAAVVATRPAAAAGTRVECVQVAQQPGRLDEAFVANFMSEQLARGHERFQTVQGVSTVLCAW